MREGWEIKALDNVVDYVRGLTYSKKDEVEISSNIVLRSNNVDLSTHKLDFKELRYIKDTIKVPEAKKVKKNSLIICTANGSKIHLGKVALIDRDYGYAFGGFMGQLIPNETINPKYLFYALTSDFYKKFISELSDGANINNLKFDDLKNFSFPVAPVSEQKRIVEILDNAFAAIDKAKANVEKNLQNAKELFENYLQKVFEKKGENWEEKRLGELCSRVSVGHVGPTSEFYCDQSVGVPFLRSQNVRSGRLEWQGIKYITKEFHKKLKKSQLIFGDILFVRVGANRGDCCIMKEDVAELNCANIVFARLKQGNVDFIDRYCQSKAGKRQLLGMSVGAAQGVINTKSVAELIIPYPTVKEQERIVERLNVLNRETYKLENTYNQKLNDLEELKKSILQKAFIGELTTHEIVT